jgi:hypothetical protein
VGSSEDLQSFELRKDVSDVCERLRKAKAANRDRRMWNALFMQLRNLIQYLSDLTVKVRRSEYFERVDRLRALGQSTLEEAATAAVSRTNHVKLCRGGEALNEVARFIRRYGYSTDEAKVAKPYCQERWLDLLFGYLTNQLAVAKTEDAVVAVGGLLRGKDNDIAARRARLPVVYCDGRPYRPHTAS